MNTCGGIIIKNRKILLLKRGPTAPTYPNHWTMPGGGEDEGETPEQTVIREVKEESGLDFTPTELIKKWQDGPKLRHRYLGTWKGKIKIQEEEVTDHSWFTYEEAIKLPIATDYREIIELIKQRGLID